MKAIKLGLHKTPLLQMVGSSGYTNVAKELVIGQYHDENLYWQLLAYRIADLAMDNYETIICLDRSAEIQFESTGDERSEITFSCDDFVVSIFATSEQSSNKDQFVKQCMEKVNMLRSKIQQLKKVHSS